jgi:hypothetical protein
MEKSKLGGRLADIQERAERVELEALEVLNDLAAGHIPDTPELTEEAAGQLKNHNFRALSRAVGALMEVISETAANSDYHYAIIGKSGELIGDGFVDLDTAIAFAEGNGGYKVNMITLPFDENGNLDYEAEPLDVAVMWERSGAGGNAKLIGHCFGRGDYCTWEINGLNETDGEYKKIEGETTEYGHPFVFDGWSELPKQELRSLRQSPYDPLALFMYSEQKDMPHFKALVVKELSRIEERWRKSYESILELLKIAGNMA